jgi:hypothetical protein
MQSQGAMCSTRTSDSIALLGPQVLPAILQAMQVLLPLRRQAGRPPSQLHAMLDRGLLKLAKTVADILNTHPWCAFALESLIYSLCLRLRTWSQRIVMHDVCAVFMPHI